VEAGARLAELTYLGSAPVPLPPHLLQEWFDSRLHGEYARVSELLITAVAEIKTAALLVDEALMGPSFLASGLTDDIFVEDVLPGWRLQPLIHQARADFVPAGEEVMHYCADTLPRQVGLPGSRNEINRLVADEGDLFGAATLAAADDEVLEFLDNRQYRIFSLNRYRLGFASRSTNNSAPYLPGSREKAEEFFSIGGFDPVLEIYRDAALWNDVVATKDEGIVISAYVELVRTSTVNAVLDKTFDLRVLRAAEKSLAEILDGDLTVKRALTATALVSALVGEDATMLFVF
jgi:hypothetical protein